MSKMRLFLMACMMAMLGSIAGAYEGSFPDSTPDTSSNGFPPVILKINTEYRTVLVHRPSGISSPALLILLSGTGSGSYPELLDDQHLGTNNVRLFSDQEGVVIAAPTQRKMTWGDWDNHSEETDYWETATAEGMVSDNPNINPDLLLLTAVMDEAVRAYGVDPNRIYLLGFSNGAFFSYFAATVLSNRVAAFAESGGGLVLSNTTAGEPLCSSAHTSGISSGEIRSCAELGWTPQTCNYTGAIPRPIAPAGKKVPPGFLSANDNDRDVRFAHTCNLANALQGITDIRTEIFHFEKSPEEEGGHSPTAGYLENAWNFMKDKRLSGSSNCALSSKTDLPDAIYGLQCIARVRQCSCQTGLDAIIGILRVLAGL